MGTHMNVHIECHDSAGIWRYVEPPVVRADMPTFRSWFIERDYDLFSRLAGVRFIAESPKPICSPRGIPIDISQEAFDRLLSEPSEVDPPVGLDNHDSERLPVSATGWGRCCYAAFDTRGTRSTPLVLPVGRSIAGHDHTHYRLDALLGHDWSAYVPEWAELLATLRALRPSPTAIRLIIAFGT